jgi:AcrR family transcriptional regulator
MPEPGASPLKPPQQSRSRRTLERIVGATLEILEEEGPGAVTVQAVVRQAGSSVGSFYARFGGKDDLLEYVGGRLWDEVLERWTRAVMAEPWAAMDLGEIIGGCVGLLFDVGLSRARQLREMDALSTAASYQAFRERMLRDLQALLLERREEIGHADPELAVRLGLMAVMGISESEFALEAGGREGSEGVEQECVALLSAYLAAPHPPHGGPQAEFFDVWA